MYCLRKVFDIVDHEVFFPIYYLLYLQIYMQYYSAKCSCGRQTLRTKMNRLRSIAGSHSRRLLGTRLQQLINARYANEILIHVLSENHDMVELLIQELLYLRIHLFSILLF